MGTNLTSVCTSHPQRHDKRSTQSKPQNPPPVIPAKLESILSIHSRQSHFRLRKLSPQSRITEKSPKSATIRLSNAQGLLAMFRHAPS
jgi:hypothetical protein